MNAEKCDLASWVAFVSHWWNMSYFIYELMYTFYWRSVWGETLIHEPSVSQSCFSVRNVTTNAVGLSYFLPIAQIKITHPLKNSLLACYGVKIFLTLSQVSVLVACFLKKKNSGENERNCYYEGPRTRRGEGPRIYVCRHHVDSQSFFFNFLFKLRSLATVCDVIALFPVEVHHCLAIAFRSSHEKYFK